MNTWALLTSTCPSSPVKKGLSLEQADAAQNPCNFDFSKWTRRKLMWDTALRAAPTWTEWVEAWVPPAQLPPERLRAPGCLGPEAHRPPEQLPPCPCLPPIRYSDPPTPPLALQCAGANPRGWTHWEQSLHSQRLSQVFRYLLPPNGFPHGWLEPQVLPTLMPTFPNTPHKSYSWNK